MTEFSLYNTTGKKVGTVPAPALFSTPVNEKLIHRYFVWVTTMLRPTVAHTKTRGEVSGGGRKPWKQKGTGRARSGSNRNPIWRKGGTIFGPRKEQTFETRMPRGERRLALFSALSSKAAHEGIMVLDEWKMSAPKTKDAVAVLNKLELSNKKVLHLHNTYSVAPFKAVSNLPKVTATTVQQMNIIDILNSDVILMDAATLQALEQHFTPTV